MATRFLELSAISLFLAVTQFACGDDDDDSSDGSSVARDLKSADFTAEELTTLSDDDIREVMEDFDAHKNRARKSLDPASTFALNSADIKNLLPPFESLATRHRALEILIHPDALALTEKDGPKSIGGCMFSGSTLKVPHSDRVVWEIRSSDISSCFKASFGGSSDLLKDLEVRMNISVFMEIHCPGADYSPMDGLLLDDLIAPTENRTESLTASLSAVKQCDIANNYMEYVMKMRLSAAASGKLTTGGKSASFKSSLRSITATMAAAGGPCRYRADSATVTVDDCQYYEYDAKTSENTEEETDSQSAPSMTATAASPKVSRIRTEARIGGARGPLDKRYLAEGEIPITINSWAGKIALDGSANPPWSLESDGKTLVGRVGSTEISSSPSSTASPTPEETPIPQPTSTPTTPYDIPELNLSPDAQVHYVGVYEADGNERGFRQQTSVFGQTAVNVDIPDAPVILVLTSYEGTEFSIETAPGTEVALVILSGYHPSKIRGLSSKTNVLARFYENTSDFGDVTPLQAKFPYFYAYKDDSEQRYEIDAATRTCLDKPLTRGPTSWEKAQNVIKDITGKDVTSAQGQYRGTTEGFRINSSSSQSLDRSRDSGLHCYKNPDGSLVPGFPGFP